MSDATHEDPAHGHGGTQLHFSRRGYLTGFLLSAVLTAVPFWLAMTHAIDPRSAAAVIVIAAGIQILVHTISFLHVNSASEKGWTLLTYMFAVVIIAIVISGSLWIMYHLNQNMMPMSGAEMESHL
jgi:cytochrome o ubiquinol oxidase operon protein cyoD